MSLSRPALDHMLGTLKRDLEKRVANHDPMVTSWLRNRAHVVEGFAAVDDRDYVRSRLAHIWDLAKVPKAGSGRSH